MLDKPKDFRTGSLKGLKASVEEADYERLFPKNRYISREWLQKEYELLWPRVWQWACREEEIPNVGDYYEYRIGDPVSYTHLTLPTILLV